MRFPPEVLDEIKTRLSASEVVGRRVKLKKAGREWRGLSPFNAEKTPSFFVNDGKMAWFDFSSGRNGNIFDFVMATEGLSFPEAVERLAGEAGVALPRRTPDAIEQEQKRAGLHEALEAAAQFFQSRLAGREGGRARAYLADRQIATASQTEFRIGYAPNDRHALRDHLAAAGASVETMIEAGLLVHGDDVPVPFDRFRDRVMFPICDRSGRVIAFGGRTLDKDVGAKYLNSPETPLFHKGAVLYNHHRARKPASDRGTVIAVEGYVDVVAVTAAGYPHVVAPLGTALTGDQCELLWRMAESPILCFDGDAAGRRAAFKAVDTALPLIAPNRSFRFAFLPEGQDPDDLARMGGATAVSDVLAQARPLVDVLWLRETEGQPTDTPEQRAGLERRLDDLVRAVGDETLRRHYAAAMRERVLSLFGGSPRSPRGGSARRPAFVPGRRPPPPPLRGYLGDAMPPPSEALARSPGVSRAAIPQREALILASLLHHPSLLEAHFEELTQIDFANADARKLCDAVVHLSGEDLHDRATLRRAIDARGLEGLRRRIEAAAEKLPHWHLRSDTSESDADHVLRQALTLQRKTQALHTALRVAEHALAQDASESSFAVLRDVQSQLATLNGMEATVDGFGLLSGRPEADI